MSVFNHSYRYAQHSVCDANSQTPQLRLVADQTSLPSAQYFEGALLEPEVSAICLRAVSDLVASRFYVPPSMLARIMREADPVVTVSDDGIRFEGFSACCSSYIRHDIGAGAYRAEKLSHGTTNVDFGADMRAALAQVRASAQLRLSVSTDAVELEHDCDAIVEKRVKLPLRWVKGFAEVQTHLAGMRQIFVLQRVEAQRFLRSLPKTKADHRQWLVATGRGVRLSQRATDTAVPIAGAQRLRVLEHLIAQADELRIYGNAKQGSSAWVVVFANQRLTLALNAEPWRGFSGDGQLLSDLASAEQEGMAGIRARLNWQGRITAAEMAQDCGLDQTVAARALAVLAAQGLLGYDLSREAFFHRVLPFDLSLLDSLNPRLEAARSLLRRDAVTITVQADEILAEVASNGVVHQVRLAQETNSCTCPWFAKNQDRRGPCKHILAAEMCAEQAA